MTAVSKQRRSPLVGKDTKFPFQVSVALWVDLLGYGSMMSEAGFNPLHSESSKALARLRRFHKIVSENSLRSFPTLVINDGAVAYTDLSLRCSSKTYDFLVRSWRLFEAIREVEQSYGFPGPRAVLACGFRMRGRRAGIDASRGHLAALLRRFEAGEIDTNQALREAASIRPVFDIVPQLQANFAFTKAYVAEAAGSAGGLAGANFYLDSTVFGATQPNWLETSDPIEWRNVELGLDTAFVRVDSMTAKQKLGFTKSSLRNGLEVAQHLAGDKDVMMALRAARKPQ